MAVAVNPSSNWDVPSSLPLENIRDQDWNEGNFWITFEKEYAKFINEEPKSSFTQKQKSIQVPQFAGLTQFDLRINPDKILPKTYRQMLKDGVLKACMESITKATVSGGFTITNGEEEHRDFIQFMFGGLEIDNVFEEFIDAFQFGHQVAEKDFAKVQWRGKTRWTIEKYAFMDVDSFHYKQEEDGTVTAVVQDRFFVPNRGFLSTGRDSIVLKPWKYTHFAYNAKVGNPYGNSGFKAAHSSWVLKKRMLQDWTVFLDQLGGGAWVLQTGSMKAKESAETLDSARGASKIVLIKGQELKIHYPPTGNNQFQQIVQYYDQAMAESMGVPLLIIGQNTEFGSRALSETHFALFKLTRIQPLQNELKRILQRDIKQIIDANFGVQEEYPTINFNAWSVLEREQLANFFRKLADMQAVGTEDVWWIREKLELPPMGANGIGDPLVRIPDEPAQGDRGEGVGDTTDDIEPTKREGSNVG